MIQIAIVDDERDDLCELSKKVELFFSHKVLPFQIHTFLSGQNLIQSSRIYDLIFLDIQMTGMSGLETAKQIRKSSISALLVFVTILPEYVFDAFEVDASDYLIKPIDNQRFDRLMQRLYGKIRRKDQQTFLLSNHPYKSLLFREIFYCEAVNHKVEIHTNKEVYTVRFKIEDLEKQLDCRFFRCHRSYLINLAYVRGYEQGLALLSNAEKVPVSRLRKQEFLQAVLTFMKN